ncbi:uncharacterized protein [Drosophila bipectinata]|uniref:uncharacterized protein n=1 Tax=Drosophila bipectinata TaxID=42026 RepID=UPI0038B3A46F
MGGTRCIFRDCTVTSKRHPKMHFFKLPLRDSKRLGAWLKNGGKEHILNDPNKKLDCRTVCARHFRIECFMNYKMNRLLPQVTPTLIRINKSLAIDLDNLDENGDAVLVKLETPQQPHLIAPNDFDCPLGLNDTSDCGQEIWNPMAPQKDQTAKNQEASDSSRCDEALLSCEDRLAQDDDQPQTAKFTRKYGTPSETGKAIKRHLPDDLHSHEVSKKIKQAQESQSLEIIDLEEDENHLQDDSISQPNVSKSKEILSPILVKLVGRNKELKVQKLTSCNQLKQLKPQYLEPYKSTKCVKTGKESAAPETNCSKYEQIILETYEDMETDQNNLDPYESIKSSNEDHKELSGIEASTQTLPEDHEIQAQIDAESQTLPDDQGIPPRIEAETQTLPDDQEKLARFEAETQTLEEEPTRDQLLLQYSQLKSDYEKIIKENSQLKLAHSEQPKIPTSNKSAANSLTKPQLYMAIKKYLGPTMAALLRIELFGGSEDRSWKEDEQEFAVELLQLGEEVYKYCCDEWRFRLPPLRLARTWLETENQTSKDDETLDL